MCTMRAYEDKLHSLHYKISYIYIVSLRVPLILTILLLKNLNLFGFCCLLHLILVPFQMFEDMSRIK